MTRSELRILIVSGRYTTDNDHTMATRLFNQWHLTHHVDM